ncbi:MAG TPA: hypothetical protein EYG11_15190 [Candidatus Latescibacteria bacterium]|nr:hypothetical protein [Candidatus Handelsmanbacteria bacterium]HIL10044.1 hypothetical protein [Candidatus Latescibacterota bacterium]
MLGSKNRNPNQEIEEYRDLMQVPDKFEDGFTIKAILGVFFVAFIMVPGNMYLSLMIGGSLGAAAEWVTIILFAEITKRSFSTLKRQEVYVLFYVAASLIAAETGAFEGLLYNQYLVQSPAAKQFGITKLIPTWVAPQPDSEAIITRTFLHADWAMPIVLLVLGMIIWRVNWFTMSYALFRLSSDYERLPFPFAPVNALGAIALAETTQGGETWRWRVFSAGAMIGLVFGAIYVALPAITGAMLTEPITLIPIPFVDFTQVTGNFIPATPLGFTAHLGPIFTGLIVPFWGVVGTFLGVVVATIANPILYTWTPSWREEPYLNLWRQGMGTIDTYFVNNVDFWMSFGIGTTVAIAIIGVYQVVQSVRNAKDGGKEGGVERNFAAPEGRGDFPIWLALALYSLATVALIGIAAWLLPGISQFIWFFLFFGFVFTPFQSFVNARLVGMVGQTVDIPFVREATIILSGYRGVDIWFIPFPLGNYGAQTQKFREIELTGTQFTSIIRAEIFMVPIVLFTSFLYGSYIWKLAPIPSASYPYAQLIWRLRAYQQCLFITGTMKSELAIANDKAGWTPANLSENEWWYWRARLASDEWLDSGGKRGEVGPWMPTQVFYSHFDQDEPDIVSDRFMRDVPLGGEEITQGLPQITPLGPAMDSILRDPRPMLEVAVGRAVPAGWSFYFEVDTDPLFTSSWIQHSTDEPWLYRAIKPEVIAFGAGFGLLSFILLSILGLPILLIFGFVRSLTHLPHFVVTEIIGALLARYYFWNKYGRKEWLQFSPILAVGFSCGMALMGMAAVGVALIQKSVSVLTF